MKIVTVVGARPQFIKASVVSPILRIRHKEILVHTGQHYDYNMSEMLFKELCIPDPEYNLGISGGTHGQMTGRMLSGIEEVLMVEQPDWLLVYGDTNSTLAAALAAAKLHIRICHVEAGCRTHSMTNPEEINRICTDHVSSLLLMSTKNAEIELKREGLFEKAYFVGDPMYDAFIKYRNRIDIKDVLLKSLDGQAISVPEDYYYLTCHREENTDREDVLIEIFKAMDDLDARTVYPVHPRNVKHARRIKDKYRFNNIILVEPVGYIESICLVCNAKKIVTDSGGLQREAFFAGKKCVTILDFVVWPETMVAGRNELSRPIAEEIRYKLGLSQIIEENYMPFGDGQASKKIVELLEKNR